MANKTIHELNQATTVTGSHEFAVYDTSNNSTQRASLAQIFDNNEILWADDEDEPISTDPVDFDSADELNPTDTENVTLLTGTDSWSQRFQKISQMFKNIRFILGKLGTTDISSIGNGTVTGALSELNSNLAYKDFTIDNISIEQGTIGTRALQTNIDVGLTGYDILSYDIFHVNDSTKAIFQVFRGLGETYPNRIYLNVYRAVATNAINLSVTIRVYYTKLSMINKN